MIDKQYLANRILNANEAQLVAILLEGLIDALASAKGAMQKPEEKNDPSIQKAREILAELLSTLEGDSQIAMNLRSLYLYVNQLITQAEIKREEDGLIKAIQIVTPIYEAWEELGKKEQQPLGKTPAIVSGLTYGKGQLHDHVLNSGEHWKMG